MTSTNNKPTTILIADDHPVIREGLIKIIEQNRQFKIIARATEGNEALRLLTEQHPDLAVLDISMPGKNGLDIIRKAKEENLSTNFIILTMYNDEEYFNAAMDLGVKGYLLKDNAVEELLSCLKVVADGHHYICPSISEYLIKQNANLKKMPAFNELTAAEKQILKLISQNKTSKQIAEKLFISVRTVQNHRNNICHKLDLHGPNKLLEFAIKNKSLL